MPTLAKYIVELEAQSRKYVAELEAANKKLKAFHDTQKGFLDSISTGFKVLGGALAVKMFAGYIKDSIDAADQTVKLSQKVGIAVETLQGMALGAQLAGVSTEGLNTGLIRLSRSMSDAAQGSATQKRAFDAIGVAVQNADGTLRGTDAVLRDVADRFAATADGARKAAIAQELFGRSGADLIPLLNGGSKGLDAMVEQARKLGIVWSAETARAAEHFNDSLMLLSAAGRGFSTQVAQQMIPALDGLTTSLVNFSTQTQVTQRLGSGLGTVLGVIAKAALGATYGMVGLADRMAGSLAALNALATDGLDAARGIIRDLEQSQRALEQQMNDAFAAIDGGAQKAAGSLGEVKAEAGGVAAAVTDASKTEAIDKQVQALVVEATTFGKTRAEAELFKLALQGASQDQLDLAQGALNLISVLEQEKKALASFSDGLTTGGGQGPTHAVDPGLDELAAMTEAQRAAVGIAQDTADQIDRINKQRSENAIRYAQAEVEANIAGQIQELDFRAAVAQASAQLIQGVFGESRAVQLAAIAFEKLMAVRRIKIAVDLAAWQAFQSQLIPGDPTSLARAAAAYAAVKARGAVTIAQTVALSIVSGLAEASSVLASSGALGSFSNPLNTQAGSANAPGGAAVGQPERSQSVTKLYFQGPFYGWDDYIQSKVIDGIRSAVDNRDVVIIGPGSRQADVLLGG